MAGLAEGRGGGEEADEDAERESEGKEEGKNGLWSLKREKRRKGKEKKREIIGSGV